MTHRLVTALGAALLVALAACMDRPPSAPHDRVELSLSRFGRGNSYIIDLAGNSVPASLAADVARAGGTLTRSFDQIGVAVATSSDRNFIAKAERIRGVSTVAPNLVMQWIDPDLRVRKMTLDEHEIGELAHEVGGHETFRLIQWAPDAVSAPAAWATGARGSGARVAIVDGGINHTHLDIAPNLDVARSRSFVPGHPFNFDEDDFDFWHATHVAGIVAAPVNELGTVGIAPQATLIGVKVLHGGSGTFEAVIAGIIYAATPIAEDGAGAHIINMSLGATLRKRGSTALTAREVAALKNAVDKATKYAYQRGATLIAAAGNLALDLDRSADIFVIPAQSPHVIAISALGPMGWGEDLNADLDRPASYTNHGRSAIMLSGPGGDFVLPGEHLCQRVLLAPFPPGAIAVVPCWVFDMVFAPFGPGDFSYGWAAGTSMAAPAASGVAALIVGKDGPMHPAQLEARLRQSADDLGMPGNDPFHGRGRVNALRAVQ